MTKEEFHIDMSDKIGKKGKRIGMACCNCNRSKHKGIVLLPKLKKVIRKKLYTRQEHKENARFYAILVYLISKDFEISELIICNDEETRCVLSDLYILDKKYKSISKSISDYRKENCLLESFKSRADGLAKKYKEKGRVPENRRKCKQLYLRKINYKEIKTLWNRIKENE